MGILDGITRRVESDIEQKAGRAISGGITKGATGMAGKAGGDKNACPKCKKPIPESRPKFCQNCGAKLVLTCPKCNIEFPFGTKFCGKCGTALSE